jgi:predicted permease
VTAVPLRDEIVGDVRQWLDAAAGAVAIVLLIGCANVANLLLAAATGRRREIAVRAALGAGRTRIVRQLLAEGLVLAALGGSAGVLFAIWGTRVLAASGGAWLPRATEVTVDVRVLLFAGGTSLVTGLLFAVAPALHASRGDLQESLKDGSGPAGHGRTTRRAGAVLAVAEMALAVVLVIASALLLRSFWNLQQVPAGFNPDGVLTARVSLPGLRYDTNERIIAFHASLLERLKTLPGVQAAGAVNALPMSGPAPTSWLTIEGRPLPQGEPPEVGLRAATPGYFQAMRIGLAEGRLIAPEDMAATTSVVVVNRALADRFFADAAAIGSRVRLGPNPNATWRTIVGIVDDVKHRGLESAAEPEVYLPLAQNAWSDVTVAVRTTGDPSAIAPAVRTVLQSLDRDLPLSAVATMHDVMGETMARRRLI